MSQREKLGFSWNAPRFSVATLDDLEIRPWAWRGNWSNRPRVVPSGFVPVSDIPGESFQSRLDAVAQGDSMATC
jgi:hypothetical protein